jgi:lipopolysaccharide export system ATP-binding protein
VTDPGANDSGVLRVEGLRKRFRRKGVTRTVVEDVSFHVGPGEVVGLLGPNGAGKTTTFRMTMGMLRPDSGAVLLDGRDITRLPMYQRARAGLGYLAQDPSIFRRLSVEENILAILETLKMQKTERRKLLGELLGELGLEHLAQARADTLSGGERRRLEITRSLVTQPKVMLLDEPFAGVDPLNIADIRAMVKRLSERGLGVLITDHYADVLLKSVHRAYVIAEGRILVEGSPEEIASDPRAKDAYLGQEFDLRLPDPDA